jgi:hypothetical protein
MTQSRPKGEAMFLLPPLQLRIEVKQKVRTSAGLRVQLYSGSHLLLSKEVNYWLDQCDGIPLIIQAALYKWIEWFCEEERGRRRRVLGHSAEFQLPPPKFPVNTDSWEILALDGLDGTVDK